nr:peptidylprolyl isomerase [Candidatus Pantoea edessiphila]
MRYNMKKLGILIINILISLNLFAATKLEDKIAVIVNNDIILESEITSYIQRLKSEFYLEGEQFPDYDALRNQIIQKKIVDTIIFQMAKQIGLMVTNDKIDMIIKKISTMHHTSMNQFFETLSRNNIDYDSYRKQIKKQIIVSIISSKELINRIIVYPQEITRLANQVFLNKFNEREINLSQVIVPLPENPNKHQLYEKENIARNLVIKLKRNNNIYELKKNIPYSINIENMGWSKIKKIPSIFVKEIMNSKKGDIVGPIRSGIGFHILKINDLDSNNNITSNDMQIKVFFKKLNSDTIKKKKFLIQLKDIISKFNSKEINLKNTIKQLYKNLFFVDKNINSRWILFNNSSVQNINNTLKNLKNNQITQPIFFNSGWYILYKSDMNTISNHNTIQKKLSFMNIINNKIYEELEYLIQQKISKSYIKIIKHNND